MVAGQYLVDVLVPVIPIPFTKFRKSRFKAFVKNLHFFIRFQMIWGRKDVVNPTLSENIIHYLVFEFCAIISDSMK